MWNFVGFMLPRDGYGYGTIKTAQALRALDPACNVIGMEDETDYYGAAADRTWWLAGRTVALCVPDFLPAIDSADGLIAYTMFEASKLPAAWVGLLNRHAESVIVPCAWNAEVFSANGVTRPIHIAKWGVDSQDYPRLPRPRQPGAPYTFLWSGTPDRRKGWDLAYRAFVAAFGKREDVRLVLHFRHMPPGVNGVRDPNVTIVRGLHNRPALRSMLARADCFVFPSRGEGWGSPPREAALTGLPVIATNYGGLAEEITSWALPLRVASLSKADYGFWGDDLGEWAEPDLDHLVELLRWCEREREQAATFGLAASAWLANNAGWQRTAAAVRAVVTASNPSTTPPTPSK